MDYTKVSRHRMAIEHMYRIDFASKHSGNALNRPSINMVYCDKLHGLCKCPMYRDSHVLLNIVAELLDFVPLLQLLNLVLHLDTLAGLWPDLAADR